MEARSSRDDRGLSPARRQELSGREKKALLRLLILTPQFPYPPQQGTTLRNYGLIAGLARRHQVHLISFLAPGDDPTTPHLEQLCETVQVVSQPAHPMKRRLWTMLSSRRPDMAHRLVDPAFARALQQALDTHAFDVVEFEGIEMTPYLSQVLSHRRQAGSAPRLVFDDHNAEYVLQQRVFEADIRHPRRWLGALYSLIQWHKLRWYEAWVCRHADVVAAVSEPDARALRRIVPGLEVVIVPNGIDLAAYQDAGPPPAEMSAHSLVFTGKMDFRPNVDAALWFAQQVLPLIREHVPDARFYVVGQRPHRRLDVLRDRADVVITGYVPETQPFIGGAAVYVIPLLSGGGTRFKVLEAMAIGRPIVSTSMGCDGFPVRSGREVILADEPAVFAERVVELMADPQKQKTLVAAGRIFSEQYDWSHIVPILEAAYERPRRDHAIA